MTPADLARLCPDLAGQAIAPLGAGTDCAARLVGDVVPKRPRHAGAVAALAREARVLAIARPHVGLPLPEMTFHPGPPPFTRHRLIPGVQLLAPVYDAVPEAAKDRLAADLARFHADCDALPHDALRAAGAGAVPAWPAPDPAMLARVPASLRPIAERLLRDWQALPGEDLTVWGPFDAHGWNTAFDRATQTLAGLYDFGDSGFGPLHRDLVYSALISPDLTLRLGRAYARLTLRPIDLNRLRILSGAHRLWELATSTDPGFHLAAFTRWLAFPWPQET